MTEYRKTEHHTASDDPEIVLSPRAVFVSVEGAGAPATSEWHRKKLLVTDIARQLAAVGLAPAGVPAEHLYYQYPDTLPDPGIADFYSVNPLTELEYRVMAQISDDATPGDIADARRAAASASDDGDVLGIFTIPEQLVAQVMHHGFFSNELATLARLGAEADAHGLTRSGPHQEIHLDPFTLDTPQDTLRTIIRDPVA
ncbi:GyrI-like domain-containing protein [Rhodococcoides yunnanense]|uniref:GyrI-like domain-containing protein n=1 Tax=Rhodococcoides yunnanense TaxID=278209 RepID=UPI0009354428|nr:GyrI-like domain-containing protein [Rhodococcus yunnanensis]